MSIMINPCAEGRIGGKPEDRSTEELLKNGFIVLDKWRGPTSRDVVTKVKELLGLKKAGHPGTLDPGASGVLLVLLENATKVIPALQGLDKEYAAVVHLHKDAKSWEAKEKLQEFVGTIRQRPPLRSAVARKMRKRRVYEVKLLDMDGRNLCFYVRCQAGTYVRLIAHELGQKLQSGAHLKELRRMAAGPFTEAQAVKMQELKSAFERYKEGDESAIRKIILPVEMAVSHVKKIVIKDSAIATVVKGSPVFTSGLCRADAQIAKGDLVAIMSLKGGLIALGMADMAAGEMQKRGLAVKTDRVILI